MELAPFEPAHLMTYEPGEVDRKALAGVDVAKQANEVWAGNAVTALQDGRALGFCGVGLEDDGTPVCWMLLSDELRRYPVWLTRVVKATLPALAREHGLERLEVSVPQTFHPGHKWVKRLGFEFVRWEPSGHLRYRKTWPS